MNKSKLPPIPIDIVKTMLEWRQFQGASERTMQSRLKEEFKLDRSIYDIRKSLELFNNADEIYYQTIKEEARKLSTDCLEIIDDNILALNRAALTLLNSKTISHKLAATKIAETTLKFIVQKFHLTGINNTDNKVTEEQNEELFKSLMKKLGE